MSSTTGVPPVRLALPSLRAQARRWIGCVGILLGAMVEAASSQVAGPRADGSVVTNALQARRLAAGTQIISCPISLRGVVLWASPAGDQFILQDASAGVRIEMDFRNQPPLLAGQQVRVEGRCVAGLGRLKESVLDNDGLHSATETSETVNLAAGRHPIRVAWFNGLSTFALSVEYEGPGLPRQRIPESALFHFQSDPARGTSNLVHGLDYRCYEGNWQRVPDFRGLRAVKAGTVSNFDLGVRTRDQEVGIEFTGYLEVPRDGLYTFWSKSDDGSRLYVGESSLRLSVAGDGSFPAPRRLEVGQAVREEEDCQWTEVEGTVVSSHMTPSGVLELELGLGTNRMYLDVHDVAGPAPAPLSRIRARGICRSIGGSAGQGLLGALMVPGLREIEVLTARTDAPGFKASTVAQLQRQWATGKRTVWPVRLAGLVLATSPNGRFLALQDDSGAALVEMDFRGRAIQPGQTVTLEGNCAVERDRLILGDAALVDNDGTHSMIEKSGTIFLKAGKHPLHLSWFNRRSPAGLEVYYEGPGLPRRKIPDSALSRMEVDGASGGVRWAPGLSYRCYEGIWPRVPRPALFETVKAGSVSNFDISVASREENVGLDLSGYIEVPSDGVYTFSTLSDDGSLLFVDHQPPRLEVTGAGALPAPVPVVARQIVRDDQRDYWAQAEGTVTFASEEGEALVLELTSGAGRMRVEVADGSGNSPFLLLNSRVRAVGIRQTTYTADGQKVAGALVTPGMRQIGLLEMTAARWADYPLLTANSLAETNFPERIETIVHVRGKVGAQKPGEPLSVADETGRVLVETTQAPPRRPGVEIEVLGRWSRSGSNVVLRCAGYRELAPKADGSSATLPLLSTIQQVKSLTREEAQRRYPVKIRGLITTPLEGGFFIQDSTWAIYVRCDETTNTVPVRAGDYWEVEGETFAEFAPNIRAWRAVRLGEGTLPEPLRPAWDQLINGSLDTLYVEVQGIVIAAESDELALLTRAGKVKVQLLEAEAAELKRFENALIRVRGCVIPERDVTTQQVELGRIRLSNFSISVDEPAPADPFAATLKRVPDLLQFDSRAGAIQRVKVAGQIVHGRGGEYYLMEGTNGVRVVPQARTELRAGDLVEVVGFAELGGPSPVLREAMVRRTGQAPLPPAHRLAEESLLGRQHDATLVRVQGHLVNVSQNRSEQVLEMQAGRRGFVARLEGRDGLHAGLLPGSRLELTGVYAGQGGDPALNREIDSFELLLNGPEAIRVLNRPSWWTLRHTLAVVGGMGLVILAALVWITLLHRQVEERSLQLTGEVRRREQTERQRALEQERARIAQDLHDDLGATLTQIRFLSALESRDALVPQTSRTRMGQVSEKSREMVASLDEIVWAVNPANDSLPSLGTYLCQFAEEFLRPTSIRCRLDVDDPLPPVALTSEVRHNVYLAVREALNNAAKHSQASEVWLRIQGEPRELRITLEDNGRGFSPRPADAPGNGLGNMRERLEKIGGRFECASQPGTGTVCRIWLPLRESVQNQLDVRQSVAPDS